MLNGLAGFVGAFAALVALAEVQMSNKWLRYVVGALLTVVLSMVLRWVAKTLGAAM